MKLQMKHPLYSLTWILSMIAIGWLIGSLTQSEIPTWYTTLNRSPLTPPNLLFPIAWTFLYATIGGCGSIIWRTESFSQQKPIKCLFLIQLILNWSWTPLFFNYHLIGISLLVLLAMDILVGVLIFLGYRNLKSVSLLLTPYFLWILFATHLNFYIWLYN